MTQRLLIILGLLCLFSIAQAQDDTLPIIAEELFAEGIQYEEYVPYREQRAIQWDNETRLIIYNESMVIPYPDDVERISYIRELDNGSFYVFTDWFITAGNTYVLDLTDSSFSEPPKLCEHLVQDTYVHNGWAIYRSRIDNEFRLCEMATGETSIPIPTQCEALPHNGGGPNMPTRFPVLSPNNDWILFNDCGTSFTLYSYNIATQNIVELGQANDHQLGYRVRWIDDFTVVFEFNTVAFPARYATYVADIREPDSLHFVVAQDYVRSPLFLNNPPRYMWIDFTQAVTENEQYIYEYDILTREHTVLHTLPCEEVNPDYGIDCDYEFTGVSRFSDVSAGNDNYWIIYSSNHFEGRFPTQVTIIDSMTFDILYQENCFCIALNWFSADDFEGLSSDSLLVAKYSGPRSSIEELKFISPVSEIQVTPVFDFNMSESSWGFSQNNRYFILSRLSSDSISQFLIYDIVTGEEIPITTEQEAQQDYRISFSWNRNSTISVRVSQNDVTTYWWIVTVPQISETDT